MLEDQYVKKTAKDEKRRGYNFSSKSSQNAAKRDEHNMSMAPNVYSTKTIRVLLWEPFFNIF